MPEWDHAWNRDLAAGPGKQHPGRVPPSQGCTGTVPVCVSTACRASRGASPAACHRCPSPLSWQLPELPAWASSLCRVCGQDPAARGLHPRFNPGGWEPGSR